MTSLSEPLQISKEFLLLAQRRLKTAESAYQQENYSDTISLLAQSVELSSKSFLANFNIISEQDFKEIGHLPSKGFEKSIENMDVGYENIHKNLDKIGFKSTQKIPEFDMQSIRTDRIHMKSLLSKFSKNPQKGKVSKANMVKILNTIKNLQNQLETSQNKILSDPQYLVDYKDFQKDIFKILSAQKLERSQIELLKYSSIMFYEILGESLEIREKAIVLHAIVNITTTTNFLSIITQPHAISSRYKDYKKTDLLIQYFPLIKQELENSLKDIETIFAISEKNSKQ